MINHYLRLGVKEFSNTDTIKKQYRKLAKIYHPDKNPNNPKAEEKFKEIAHSYSVLSDIKQKQAHDAMLQGKTIAGRAPSYEERRAEAIRKKEALRKHEIETRYFKYQNSILNIKVRASIAIFMMSILFSYFVINYFPNYEKPSGLVAIAFIGLIYVGFIYLIVDTFYINRAFKEVKGNRPNYSSIRVSSYLFLALFFASPIIGSWAAYLRKSTLLGIEHETAVPIEITKHKYEEEWSVQFFANYQSYTCRFSAEGFEDSKKSEVEIHYYPGDPRLCTLHKVK